MSEKICSIRKIGGGNIKSASVVTQYYNVWQTVICPTEINETYLVYGIIGFNLPSTNEYELLGSDVYNTPQGVISGYVVKAKTTSLTIRATTNLNFSAVVMKLDS